ncbi:monocarboxylate transporter 12-B-like, partial [Mizuhopecten yessoensis]|uniref:monocarboxylate transporter 12-B-like n=1 Tax=Mizuhopecten yessoensis TaxID=6573 RepID=UPI000B458E26
MDRTSLSDLQCEDGVEKINMIAGEDDRKPMKYETDCHADAFDEEGDKKTTEETIRMGITDDLVDDHANGNGRPSEVCRPMGITDNRRDELIGQRGEVSIMTKETDGAETLNNSVKEEKKTELDEKSTECQKYGNPVDQGWAWVVLIGSFGICMLIIGGLKSFGVLYVELAKKFQVSNQVLSSVQSLAGFCYLFFGPVCNALSTRFTHRVVIFTGGIMTSTGLILSSLAPSVVVLFFTYGLITGIGYSLCFSTVVVMVANYFKKYRSFASGVALSGGGLGAMLLPYLIRYFINQYGLQGAMLIYAGIMGNCCVCAMLLRPFTSYPLKSKTLKSSSTHGDREQVLLIKQSESKDKCKDSGKEKTTIILYDSALENEDCAVMLSHQHCDDTDSNNLSPKAHIERRPHLSNGSLNVMAASISCQSIPQSFEPPPNKHIVKNNPTKTKKTFLHEIKWKLFLNPVFTVFFALTFFSMVSYHSLFNVVPPFADELGMSGEDGALVLLIFGATDLTGRIAVGILMDIFPKQRHVIFTICVGVCAVGVIVTPLFRSFLTLSLFMASYGCFAGGYNSTL